MKTLTLKPLMTVMALAIAFAGNTRAEHIDLTLTNPTLFGSPGSVLELIGSLSNNSTSDVWINGAGLTLDGFGPMDSDLSPFILNATGLLIPGASTAPILLLNVTVPDRIPIGTYRGILTIQGGSNSNADGPVGAGNFGVVVTPEPATYVLFGSTLIMVALLSRLKRPATLPRSVRRAPRHSSGEERIAHALTAEGDGCSPPSQ